MNWCGESRVQPNSFAVHALVQVSQKVVSLMNEHLSPTYLKPEHFGLESYIENDAFFIKS